MSFQPVDLPHASRLLNHGPTVLVTSAHGSRRNVMAAAWSMPVEFTPPRIAVVIDKSTFTRGLVMAAGAFGLCIPGAGLADFTYAVGSVSGREVADKFERYGLAGSVRAGPVLGMPVIEPGCCAWLECRLIPERHVEQAYDTCFGEVVAAAADTRVFAAGRWKLDSAPDALQTLHHLGAGNFAVSGRVLKARAEAVAPGRDPPSPSSA
jgi:flavin reductase (DIM6/NTAB) family NADH-FMN oxidoreductase RutF